MSRTAALKSTSAISENFHLCIEPVSAEIAPSSGLCTGVGDRVGARLMLGKVADPSTTEPNGAGQHPHVYRLIPAFL